VRRNIGNRRKHRLNETELLTRLALALAIGFLIGVERGWGMRSEAEGERTAGLRTFALAGLSGGIAALLGQRLGVAAFAAIYLAYAAAIILFRWRETQHEETYGATTLVAALLTFALGAYAIVGDMTAAAAAAVATTGILAAKGWLHSWIKALTWPELRAALILLAMSFVVLPVLPNRGFGPYNALNPYELWLMAIAIAGVSFLGYVAVKVAGSRYGPLIAGVAGGVVSSTITTIDLARKAHAAPATARYQLAGALAASATMFARVVIIVALFGPTLLPNVLGSLAAAFAVSVAAAVILDPPWKAHGATKDDGPPLTNPFELGTVVLFALMLAIVVLVSAYLTANFGGRGGIAFAAVAGLSDVDAITLSMTNVAGASVSIDAAATAILVAVGTNSLSKSALAIVTGGRWFGIVYLAVSLASLAAGALAALLLGTLSL
jgi:uncharacterized membrane protein (DUF4010 family)